MVNQYRDRPRYADQYDRGNHDASRQGEGDPLAELARLIGQADPFSGFGPDRQPAAPRHDPYASREEPESYDDTSPGPPPWMRNSQPTGVRQQHYADEAHDQEAQPADWPHHDSQSMDWARQEQQPASWPRATDHGYGHDSEYRDPSYGHQSHAAYDDHAARYDDVLYGHPHDDRGYGAAYGQDQGYDDQSYGHMGHYAGAEESPPERSRSGGKLTVMVVLALAVVGTAGAYAYRSMTGAGRGGEPPVIKADAGPNKIVPPSQSAENKPVRDGIGEKIAERVVSREEQPVDINAKSAGPRIVFPPLTRNSQPPNVTSVSPSSPPVGAGTANGTLNGAEPRKIRTVSIRPDRADASPTASTSAPQDVRSIPITAPRNSPPAAQQASASNEPMALIPQSNAPAPQESRSRVAAVNPDAVAPSSGNAAGAYVQVSSQRSEADARTSYRVLQGKYPGILGSRSPVIKRADLGSKGVFYRALVGPFAAADEATQFCVNFQSAGGKCLVQRH
ncbi:SPOR domain-containing protein [Afipia sp. TerB]